MIKFEKVEPSEFLVDRASIKVRPVSAGVQMNFVGTGFCTVGFSAKIGGKYYLVSAGHCNRIAGQDVAQSYKAPNKIGTASDNSLFWGSTADAVLVKVASNLTTPWVYADGKEKAWKIVGKQNIDWEGMGVCSSLGESDTQMCGRVISTDTTTVTLTGEFLVRQKETNLIAQPGDSGSPVVTDGYDEDEVYIYGIVSSGINNISHVTWVEYIELKLGIDVITN